MTQRLLSDEELERLIAHAAMRLSHEIVSRHHRVPADEIGRRFAHLTRYVEALAKVDRGPLELPEPVVTLADGTVWSAG